MSDRRSATTIGELDTHLGYVLDNLSDLREAVSNMATRSEIEKLAGRLDLMATRAELKAIESRLDGESMGSRFSRAASLAAKLLTVIALLVALWGAVVVVVRFSDQVRPFVIAPVKP